MKLLLLLAYFIFGVSARKVEMVVPPQDVPQLQEVPREVRPAEKKQKVEIEIDGEGRVSAVSGKEKLAAFDPDKAPGMKALDEWLTGLNRDVPPVVAIKVNDETPRKTTISLLNVLTKQKVTAITLTDFPEE